MIWAILAAVGVPLWICAAGILALVLRNRMDADTCLQVAASATHRQALLGPFEAAGEEVRETQPVGAQSNGPHHD
jgi:hypothetical protein